MNNVTNNHAKFVIELAIKHVYILPSSGKLYLASVRTEVSEEISTSIIRVTRIGQLGTTLAVTSNRRFIIEDDILHSQRRENLKSYMSINSVSSTL
jgi:hypothetical protein